MGCVNSKPRSHRHAAPNKDAAALTPASAARDAAAPASASAAGFVVTPSEDPPVPMPSLMLGAVSPRGVYPTTGFRHTSDLRVRVLESKSTSVTLLNDYLVLGSLGKGAYGSVKLCFSMGDNTLYALKVLQRGQLKRQMLGVRGGGGKAGQGAIDALRREVDVMRSMNHPNLIKIFEVIEAESKVILVQEYAEAGPLVQPDSVMSEALAQYYFRQIVDGLACLHGQNVVHGDVKPDNVLLSGSGRVKIADFGQAEFFDAGADVFEKTLGTPAFMAPEVRSGNAYHGKPADMWALGVTLYVFLFGDLPFKGSTLDELYKAIQCQEVQYPPDIPISDDLRSLLDGLLSKDPTKRPTSSELLYHPWLLCEEQRQCAAAAAAEEIEMERMENVPSMETWIQQLETPAELPRAQLPTVREVTEAVFGHPSTEGASVQPLTVTRLMDVIAESSTCAGATSAAADLAAPTEPSTPGDGVPPAAQQPLTASQQQEQQQQQQEEAVAAAVAAAAAAAQAASSRASSATNGVRQAELPAADVPPAAAAAVPPAASSGQGLASKANPTKAEKVLMELQRREHDDPVARLQGQTVTQLSALRFYGIDEEEGQQADAASNGDEGEEGQGADPGSMSAQQVAVALNRLLNNIGDELAAVGAAVGTAVGAVVGSAVGAAGDVGAAVGKHLAGADGEGSRRGGEGSRRGEGSRHGGEGSSHGGRQSQGQQSRLARHRHEPVAMEQVPVEEGAVPAVLQPGASMPPAKVPMPAAPSLPIPSPFEIGIFDAAAAAHLSYQASQPLAVTTAHEAAAAAAVPATTPLAHAISGGGFARPSMDASILRPKINKVGFNAPGSMKPAAADTVLDATADVWATFKQMVQANRVEGVRFVTLPAESNVIVEKAKGSVCLLVESGQIDVRYVAQLPVYKLSKRRHKQEKGLAGESGRSSSSDSSLSSSASRGTGRGSRRVADSDEEDEEKRERRMERWDTLAREPEAQAIRGRGPSRRPGLQPSPSLQLTVDKVLARAQAILESAANSCDSNMLTGHRGPNDFVGVQYLLDPTQYQHLKERWRTVVVARTEVQGVLLSRSALELLLKHYPLAQVYLRITLSKGRAELLQLETLENIASCMRPPNKPGRQGGDSGSSGRPSPASMLSSRLDLFRAVSFARRLAADLAEQVVK